MPFLTFYLPLTIAVLLLATWIVVTVRAMLKDATPTKVFFHRDWVVRLNLERRESVRVELSRKIGDFPTEVMTIEHTTLSSAWKVTRTLIDTLEDVGTDNLDEAKIAQILKQIA